MKTHMLSAGCGLGPGELVLRAGLAGPFGLLVFFTCMLYTGLKIGFGPRGPGSFYELYFFFA